MEQIAEIIFEEMPGRDGDLGVITLNRQQALNALNHAMFIALDKQIKKWESKATIKAILIRAADGRAFCAGGDIRYAYERKKMNDAALQVFFRDEYHMNLHIRHCRKPYIALLDGITMGGGAGISIHGSHRVGTPRLVFAMPETSIGFYPDVGATYVLSRLPHHIGIYLGLTGAKISYSDCYALGIVQEIVAQESIPNLVTQLAEASLPDSQAITEILQKNAIPVPPSELMKHQDEIDTCFSKKTIEEILAALESYPSEWCHQIADSIKTKSPTSLKVTLAALEKGKQLSFDECMQMEYRLTQHFLQGHDFFEGIRAAIIDKDQKPRWLPEKFSELSAQEVEGYFSVVGEELV